MDFQRQSACMNQEQVKQLLKRGEGESIDLTSGLSKRLREELPTRLAALGNTQGGHLILGVDPDRKVVGCRLSDNEKAQILSNP